MALHPRYKRKNADGFRRQRATTKGLRRSRRRIVSWHELPEWMQENEYILSGYRREMDSVLGCMHSIFAYMHNETVNIHSHLWGAMLFAFFLVTVSARLAAYPSASSWDVASFALFLAGAVACLSFSFLAHTLAAHSKAMTELLLSLDYIGIIVFITSGSVSSNYYLFHCDPYLQISYTIGACIAGIGAACFVLSPRYNRPAYRDARVATFAALILVPFVSNVHGFYMFGYDAMFGERAVGWLIAGFVCYMCGTLIYMHRIPERWFPGRFDHLGASHQIFHVHVVLAALMHFMCIKTRAYGVLQGTCPDNLWIH